MTVRTRFAPSPTGYLHVGGARTALFSWLYARRFGGVFVLRIEDTDRERSTKQAVNAILEGMSWLGLHCDEGPYYQTERFERYAEVSRELLEKGLAYHCYCTREELDEMRARQQSRGEKPRYDGRCRRDPGRRRDDVQPVVRFKNPLEGDTGFDDLVHGPIRFSNAELDDLIIARGDGTPTYNFTVVVDDLDMGITHVIRGDDHINNTPRQVNIMRALGAEPPAYGHVPMILGPDGKRLSKRHGAVSVLEYRRQGFLPEALNNYLVRLGWSHGDQEVFSVEEMVRLFDIVDVNKGASSFNPEKLVWLNQHYLKSLDPARVAKALEEALAEQGIDTAGGPPLPSVVVAQRERSKTLVEMAERSAFLFREVETYDEKAVQKHLGPDIAGPLAAVGERLADVEPWSAAAIHGVVEGVVQETGLKFGKVAQAIRVAVTGTTVSPPIDQTLELLGRERTLARLEHAGALCAAAGAPQS